MINNYDSVATRFTSGATRSQKQENTSYTATKRNWLSFVTVFVALFSFVFVQGQTTLISPTGGGGFENGSTFAANGWTTVNPATDAWRIGNVPVSASGTNCAYVSANGGTSWTYSQTSVFNHVYRDVTIPAGETKVVLSFKWKVGGEGTTTSDWDNMKVFIAPTTLTPLSTAAVTGAIQLSGPGATSGMYKLSSTNWNTETINFSASPGSYRLIFSWKSDNTTISNPPAAIDDISMTSAQPDVYTWNATSGSASWATAASWTPARTTPHPSDILNFSNGGSSTVTSIPTQTVGNIVFSNNTTANFQAAATSTLTMGSLTVPSGSALFSNGTTAALIMAFPAGATATNTIGGRLEISNTSTTANGITFANSVTTVSGTLAAGGITAATVTGTTATLLINGTYEHKYTAVGGTIPTATWGSGSNCNVSSYNANNNPSGIGQNFANFSWNCPLQTGNMNLALNGTTTGVSGTMTITSTGSGTLRLTGTSTYTFNVNNFTQTGGTLDLASGNSGATATFNVSGTFNQSGGTFLSSGTVTSNPTLHFNGTAAQTATFTGQPTGPITYRFSNPAGVTLNTNFATFALGNGTLGGLRISTNATAPIVFGTTVTGFAYNAANSTLTYDAANLSTTATAQEFPSASGPTSLRVDVGANGLLVLPFAKTISNTLTMVSGDIDISSNALTLGTTALLPGTLTYTAGNIRVSTGSFTRWYGTATPTTIGTGVGFYPIANGTNNRNVSLYFSANTIPTGGSITVSHTASGGISAVSPTFTDGVTIGSRTNSYWSFASNTIALGTTTLGIRVTGGGALNATTATDLRFIQSAGALGTSANVGGTFPNFQAGRTGLSLTNLTGDNHYIGSTAANIQSVFNSVTSGDWNTASTWDTNAIPSSADIVNIMPGHTVTVNSASNNARSIAIGNGGATLTIASGDLTVATSVANSGTINVNAGTINVSTAAGASTTGITNAANSILNVAGGTVNIGPSGGGNRVLSNAGTLTLSSGAINLSGNFTTAATSTFNMSAGTFTVDGNSGNAAPNGNVAVGTRIFEVSTATGTVNGGTIIITDPHNGVATTQTFAYNVTGVNKNWSGNTLQLGDGSSTNPSASTRGFEIDIFVGSGILTLGNVIANGGSDTNRFTATANATGNGTCITNLTVNSNSEFRNTAATYFSVEGNITNNGTLTIPNNIVLGTPSGTATSITQTISGSGTFRNATTSPTASFGSLLINNSNASGVTINVPLSVSGTLTMTSGLINTTATNLLTLGTATAAGTLSGTPSATNMIVGPFARTFATRTAAGTYTNTTLFPIGKGTSYTPVFVDPTIAASSAATIRGEAFASNSGTGSSDVTNLSATRWEVLTTNGFANLTNANVRVSDSGILNSYELVQAPTAAGVYDRLFSGASAFAAGPILTGTGINAAALTNAGYFAYGTVAAIQPPTITGYTTAFSSVAPIALCSNGGSVVTITGTNLGTVTSVLFTGSTGLNLPGTITAKTATTVTVIAPSGVVDGVLKVINPAGNVDSSVSYAAVLPPTIGVSAAVTVCAGSSTTLSATGGATYTWSPATGLSATTGSSVTASPTVTTTYTVTGVSADGCTSTNTVTVTTLPVPSAVIITKNPTSICEGGITTLTASGGQVFSPLTTSLGAGASTSSSLGGSMFPGAWGGAKTQYLIRASELTALGLSAGNINSLAFEATASGQAYPGFALSIGTTSQTQMTNSGYVSGLTQVYTNSSFTPTVGVNALTFSSPFNWDGTSNIVVSFCWSTGTGTSSSSTVKTDTVAYNSTYGWNVDSLTPSTVCATTGLPSGGNTAVLGTTRPKFTFDVTGISNSDVTWTNTTDLYSNAAATTAYAGENLRVVYSKSTTSQTYTATATLGSCSVSTPVTVTPNALPTITLDTTTPVCFGGTSSSLSFTATTGTPNEYTIDFDAAANTAGFADITTFTAFTTSPISLVVPAGAAPGTYNGTIKVKNATTGCESATSQAFTITINTPVAITSQPSNSVSLVNTNASFTVAATGSGLTYQWQESTDNGVTWNNISGATSATYTAVSVSNGMNGNKYQCIVSGAAPCTSVTSNVVTLTISTTAITTQPASTAICSNGSATFTIATTGTPPTYQWQISTNSGTSWSDIVGETNTTLTVSGLTSANSLQQYRCVLSPGPINSDAAILTVNDIVAITTQPTDVTVCSTATNATFTTAATGSGLTYQWQQRANSSGTWANVGTGTTGGTTATLTVNPITLGLDGFQYQCIVAGVAPCVTQTTATATLSVNGFIVGASASNICIGSSFSLVPSTTASTPSLTYSWVCATPGSGATTAVTGNPATITPTQVGTYIYTLTTTGGACSFTTTKTIVVNALPVITTATANPTVACAGSTINLAATINEVSSGSATIGAGASTSSTYSNPFYSLWSNNHTQHLITAAELTAMGLSSGNITSVGLNVTSAGSLPMIDFSVKIGTTSSTSMTAFVSNSAFQTVYTSASLMPTSGVNTLTFSTPFNWDGTSNLVLEFCHGNSASTATMSRTVQADNTSYVSTVKSNISSSAAAATICGDTSTNLLSYSVRPVFIFGGQVSTNTTSNYTWSWSNGSATVLSAASGTTTLPAGATTTYTVTATNPTTLCAATQTVTVSTAVAALALTGVTPATSNICVGASVALTAAPTGGCIPYTYSWSDGTTVVGTTPSITVSPTSTKTYTVTITDNTGSATVTASSTINVNNPQPTATGQTICSNSAAFTLTGTASTSSNVLKWYAAATGGNALATGATFTTPAISATTTYFVQENALDPELNGIGLNNTTVPNSTGASSERGIVFTATKAFTLVSAQYYSPTTSVSNTVIIRLVDNATGTQIATKTLTIPQGASASWYTMNIGFDIVPGTYRLLAGFSQSVNRSTTGFTYPYTLGSSGSITSGFDSGVSASTYSYFHNITIQEFCPGLRVPVTATLNAPPSLVLASSAATICSGQSTAAVALTSDPLSFTGYTWSPATGVSGTSASGWTFNPTTTTTYTLSATNGTCSNTATFTVNVNPSPSAITISPATPAVCVGSIQALTATGGTLNNLTILSENFNAAAAGWTAINSSTGGTPVNAAWQSFISNSTASSNDNSNFIGSNSDAQGSGGTTDTSITSPVFNLSNFSSASLNFYHHFNSYSSADSAKVQVSTNGSTWVDVTTYTTDQGALTGFALSTINLNAYVGNSSVQVRFKYNASWGLYWLIDNVSVTGTQTTTVTWSPITNLYSDAAATVPYVLNANASTVYVKSATAATTTYTVTSTAAGTACTNTASVNVVVNPLPTVITVNQTICAPSTVNLQNAAVTLGSDAGLTYTYWTNAAATTALTNPGAVATSNTYYIKGTNANGCSVVTPVTVTINPQPTLTVTNPATVCSPNTINITASAVTAGSDAGTLSYWSDSNATTALTTPSAVTTSGVYYIKLVNANGCERIMPVTVTINVVNAPTGAATQTFCGASNITQLVATGTGIKWYDAATGGNLLPNITAIGLTNGTTYYASQTVNGCESTARFAVTAVINPIPTAPNASAQSFCNAALVSDLIPNGSAYTWYDAATGGNVVVSSASIASGTYFVSQTVNGCESTRTAVIVTINTTTAPTASAQTFCNTALVANLVATGTGLKWYTALTGGAALSASTVVATGTYFVSQTINGCESTRTSVAVTVNVTAAPTAASQTFCSSGTVANLVATGSNLQWFTTQTGGSPIATTTALTSGIYFVSQTVNGCESIRTAVNVTISTPATPTGSATQTIFGGVGSDATIEDISVSGTNVIWYPTAADATAGTNAIAPGTLLVSGTTYYAVSVVGTCRSTALAVTVTVVLDTESFDIKSLKYYPNPVVDILTISYSSEITSVQVYDLSGRQIRNMSPNSNLVTVDLSDLATSVYVVRVFANDTSSEFKVVKK